MIRLHPNQIDAMAEVRLAGMIHGHLAVHHAEAYARLAAPARDEIVANGIVRSRSYGMSAPSSIGAMTALMLEIGPGFDRSPVIRDALTDASVSPDERVGRLAERIERLLGQAQAAGVPGAQR